MKTTILTALTVAIAHLIFAQQTAGLKPLNINFKNRAYCYAASAPLPAVAGFGGWGGSNNIYQPVSARDQSFPNELILLLKPDEPQVFAENFAGFTLYIINQTSDTIFFEAQDSRLNMILQARDKKGEWRDIEYLPSSWCGNSYHQVYLPADYQWQFTVPEYSGSLKTNIRAVLAYKLGLDTEEQLLYSNEIEGSVNPGQFDKMPKYKPNGLIDPYNN